MKTLKSIDKLDKNSVGNKPDYTINIEYNNEDKCYIARVPDLGPYISAFGETYENALKEIQIVIDLTLKTYKDDGLYPPKPNQNKNVV